MVETRESATLADYLAREEASEMRHEFRDGEIVALEGSTAEHGVIAVNTMGEIRGRLPRPRDAYLFGCDMRVRQIEGRCYAYPDGCVVVGRPLCNDAAFPPRTVLTNPALILEVMDEDTVAYDRDEKFFRYVNIPSLREYVLIWQSRHRVETHFRNDDGTWSFAFWDGLAAVARLRSLEIDLPLAEVYAGADFDDAAK